MKSQWDCIRQNIGTWHGSFTQFSAGGEPVKEVPSVLTLEETVPDEKMQLTLQRTPPGEGTDTTQRMFSAPGLAPYVYFFESGAFSQGPAQWVAFGQFGAEMSIKVGDRRVRFVIMYESNHEGTSQIKYVTLIRETRTQAAQSETSAFETSASLPKQLSGQWIGRVQVLYAAMSSMSEGHSEWQLESSALVSKETFNETIAELSLSGDFDLADASLRSVILLGALTYQFMPLPNGAYCLTPQTLCKGKAFRIEVGWLRENRVRSRLIRYYDSQGIWISTALVEDSRS